MSVFAWENIKEVTYRSDFQQLLNEHFDWFDTQNTKRISRTCLYKLKSTQ